jgi:release factor glutamine methyltransferase
MLVEIKHRKWLLLDVLNEAIRFLKSHHITNARGDAEQLLSHVLELQRIQLYLQFEQPLSEEERDAYKQLLRRRIQQEPLQYIVGQTEFMSLPFHVQPGILIPRPETEILAEKAIEQIQEQFKPGQTVHCLDVGTGSGNIAVSLAYHLKNISIVAIDIDINILTVAEKNAEINRVRNRIQFILLNIMNESNIEKIGQKFDIVISNPPYVSEEEYGQLPTEIKKYEPKQALDGGQDGLRFYGHLQRILPRLLKKEGMAFFEIGADQADNVKAIFLESFGENIKVFQDLAQRDRVIFMQKGNRH